MAIEPGEAVLGGETAETRPKDAGVEAGDAVALSGKTAVAANTEANEFGGIAGETAETRPKDAGVEAGDAVALGGGTAAAANTEANEFGGIAGETDRVILSGPVVASVAAGVTEGSRLGAGNATGGTTGQLIASAGGPALALSDEGGTWHSEEGTYDVPDGYAVVHL